MDDRVLVLGAGGFIGQALVRALAQHGKSVIAVSRRPIHFAQSNVEQVTAEFREPEDFLPLLTRSQTVVHLASRSTPGSSAGQPLSELEENLRPTLALLQALQTRPTCSLLYVSSAGSLYGGALPAAATEYAIAHPKSYHGAGKAAAEYFINAWCNQYSGAATVLRPSNVYGPGQPERFGFGIVPGAFGKLLRQENLTVWGNGSAIRDYLYIDDFIDLCVLILDTPMPTGFRVFNAASGMGVDLNTLFEKIEAVSGRRLLRTHDHSRSVDFASTAIDCTLVKQTYGWAAETGLNEGLEQTWAWFNTTPR